ncbi:LacI family DNA-binding transcriptional regulator [Christiangramia forsetii]|uniref:LacI family transcriptional regulator protein n=2 Tax=Christiangramia forsetii TaxID=411153 RepID=A0M0J3_CHRFK|nr:LacI family DNA-binding transcriptional regulator [Christiangramia forsetii]GGG40758.1 LacI family transcriptional regulator [Christiangramia forsetii]CAL66138.1 LacI family transcriptional regulator protein [Christiangramia forsetii KT0803]
MRNEITLQELALSLNLSISTVSKSLNDSPEISVKTKSRVKELALLKRYIPNSMAQSLKGKQSKTIGVVIPNIFSKFFSESLHAIENKANERGFRTIICFSNDSIDKEAECIEKLIKSRVDGIILAVSEESQYKKINEHIEKVLSYKIPLVMLDHLEDTISCDKVGLNETLLAEEATMNLFNLGYRNVAFLAQNPSTNKAESQKQGYLDAIKRKDGKKQILSFGSSEVCHQKLHKLIHSEKIDAVIVNKLPLTIFGTKNCSKSVFSIPENVHVLSLSNLGDKEHLSTAYDAYDRLGEEQGDIAVDTLLDRIEGVLSEEFVKFELKGRLNCKSNSAQIQKLSI